MDVGDPLREIDLPAPFEPPAIDDDLADEDTPWRSTPLPAPVTDPSVDPDPGVPADAPDVEPAEEPVPA